MAKLGEFYIENTKALIEMAKGKHKEDETHG